MHINKINKTTDAKIIDRTDAAVRTLPGFAKMRRALLKHAESTGHAVDRFAATGRSDKRVNIRFETSDASDVALVLVVREPGRSWRNAWRCEYVVNG